MTRSSRVFDETTPKKKLAITLSFSPLLVAISMQSSCSLPHVSFPNRFADPDTPNASLTPPLAASGRHRRCHRRRRPCAGHPLPDASIHEPLHQLDHQPQGGRPRRPVLRLHGQHVRERLPPPVHPVAAAGRSLLRRVLLLRRPVRGLPLRRLHRLRRRRRLPQLAERGQPAGGLVRKPGPPRS